MADIPLMLTQSYIDTDASELVLNAYNAAGADNADPASFMSDRHIQMRVPISAFRVLEIVGTNEAGTEGLGTIHPTVEWVETPTTPGQVAPDESTPDIAEGVDEAWETTQP